MVIAERPEVRQTGSQIEGQPNPVPEILAEEILQQGSFRTVRRYLRGWHPDLGILSQGWQGPETIVVKDVIRPIRVFTVLEVSAEDYSYNGAVDKIEAIAIR